MCLVQQVSVAVVGLDRPRSNISSHSSLHTQFGLRLNCFQVTLCVLTWRHTRYCSIEMSHELAVILSYGHLSHASRYAVSNIRRINSPTFFLLHIQTHTNIKFVPKQVLFELLLIQETLHFIHRCSKLWRKWNISFYNRDAGTFCKFKWTTIFLSLVLSLREQSRRGAEGKACQKAPRNGPGGPQVNQGWRRSEAQTDFLSQLDTHKASPDSFVITKRSERTVYGWFWFCWWQGPSEKLQQVCM